MSSKMMWRGSSVLCGKSFSRKYYTIMICNNVIKYKQMTWRNNMNIVHSNYLKNIQNVVILKLYSILHFDQDLKESIQMITFVLNLQNNVHFNDNECCFELWVQKNESSYQKNGKYNNGVLHVSDNLNQMYSIILKWKWTVLIHSDKWHALCRVQSFHSLPHSPAHARMVPVNVSCAPLSSQFDTSLFM